MAQNMIGLLKDQFDDKLVGKMAGILGENKSLLMSAIGSALPSFLLGLMKKSTEPGGAEGLLKTLEEGKHDGGILDNLDGILSGGSETTDLVSSGKGLLESIFGDKAAGLGGLIASASGISRDGGSSLLAMLAPIVMGFLGKALKSQEAFNSAGLMSMLLGQKDSIKAALPAGATSLLGVNDLENLGRQATGGATKEPTKILPWIAVLIVCLLLVWAWRGCGKVTVVEDAAKQVGGQVTGAMEDLGKFFTKKLPSGIELNVPELGVENKLIAFIEDKARALDDKTWFTFDRLTFETGKATLKQESQEQLKNIAEILKAYPKVTLKLGGYTDNKGDPQANLKLSQQRADTVMADLVSLGVDAGRLKAEGYGQEYPVADNATEEGRAKNRRIDLRVTAK